MILGIHYTKLDIQFYITVIHFLNLQAGEKADILVSFQDPQHGAMGLKLIFVLFGTTFYYTESNFVTGSTYCSVYSGHDQLTWTYQFHVCDDISCC